MIDKSQRIGVLMGGRSSEREISLISGNAVLKSLQQSGFPAIGIDLREHWAEHIHAAQLDIACIALHGTWGEDGCIQGLLETMGIPYTGSGVLGSSINMNKKLCKTLLHAAGIPTPVDIPLTETGPIRYPVIIKPVSEGSSVGLHILQNENEWQDLTLDPSIAWMAEMPVRGVEIAVGVLNGKALPCVEIAPKSGVYDYQSKYTSGHTEYFCPARLPVETLRRCMEVAEQATAVTFCYGAPRVDMIVPDGGEPVVLEINTIPGMTPSSLLPKSAAAAGMDFDQLCIALLQSAHLDSKV